MIDIIPELEMVIGIASLFLFLGSMDLPYLGQQPAVANVGAVETLHRAKQVMSCFVLSLASKEHPLVIFLDDLQCKSSIRLTQHFIH